jgi:hypothetical protein
MTLLELMVSSLLSSALLISLSQSGLQIYQSIKKQEHQSTLQNEALQAMQMMGQAIQSAGGHSSGPKSKEVASRLMVKDSAAMSNTQINQFVIRKGAASMDGSDAFFTNNALEESGYQAFFVQHQGHHEQREGVLYLQTKNKKGRLQNDALIGHVHSLQIQAGIPKNHSMEWYEPYEISERASKSQPHWKQVRAIRIHLKLQKGNHPLEIIRIFALRNPS